MDLQYKFRMHTKRLKLDKFYVKISYLNLFNLLRANSTRVSKNPLKFSIYDTKNPWDQSAELSALQSCLLEVFLYCFLQSWCFPNSSGFQRNPQTYPTTMSLGPALTVHTPSSQNLPTKLWACKWTYFPLVTNWTITFAGPT